MDLYIARIFSGDDDPFTQHSFYMVINDFMGSVGHFESGKLIPTNPQCDLVLKREDQLPPMIIEWMKWMKEVGYWTTWMDDWTQINIIYKDYNEMEMRV